MDMRNTRVKTVFSSVNSAHGGEQSRGDTPWLPLGYVPGLLDHS